nr:MAG TPA: hypothetical protein [Caudoviricetes sp.]
MWSSLGNKFQQLAVSDVFSFFGGYLSACIILALVSGLFTWETKVSLVELLTLAFSLCAAVAVPLLIKRLTSDSDARRGLFLEDVASLLHLYETSAIDFREYFEKKTPKKEVQSYVRKFTSSSERSLDLIQREITHLGRFSLPNTLQVAIHEYEHLLGDAPFQDGFIVTDDFLKRQDELLHSVRLEVRKYQHEVFLQ